MVDVPVIIALTTPVEDPMVATDVLLLAHVPPPASMRVVVLPGHTAAVPLIAAGKGNTVATVVTAQPVLVSI